MDQQVFEKIVDLIFKGRIPSIRLQLGQHVADVWAQMAFDFAGVPQELCSLANINGRNDKRCNRRILSLRLDQGVHDSAEFGKVHKGTVLGSVKMPRDHGVQKEGTTVAITCTIADFRTYCGDLAQTGSSVTPELVFEHCPVVPFTLHAGHLSSFLNPLLEDCPVMPALVFFLLPAAFCCCLVRPV